MRLNRPERYLATLIVAFALVFAGSQPANALPLTVIEDTWADYPFGSNTFVSAPNTFASTADVGGVITYTVNAGSVRLDDGLEFFYAGQSVGDVFFTMTTVLGQLYEVDFDHNEIANSAGHAIDVSAVDGTGLGGATLGSSGPVGGDGSANFTFTASSTSTTIRALGVFGTSSPISDIELQRLRISTVPEPSTALLLGTGLLGLAMRGRRRKT